MYTQTIHELIVGANRHKGRFRELATESNLSYAWVCQFASENIKNPGIVTCEKLRLGIAALDRRKVAEANATIARYTAAAT